MNKKLRTACHSRTHLCVLPVVWRGKATKKQNKKNDNIIRQQRGHTKKKAARATYVLGPTKSVSGPKLRGGTRSARSNTLLILVPLHFVINRPFWRLKPYNTQHASDSTPPGRVAETVISETRGGTHNQKGRFGNISSGCFRGQRIARQY